MKMKSMDLDNLIDISTNSLSPEELFLTNGFKLIISRKMADLIQGWFKNKFMVIYKANALELIRRFDDSDAPGIYVEKRLMKPRKYLVYTRMRSATYTLTKIRKQSYAQSSGRVIRRRILLLIPMFMNLTGLLTYSLWF